jgi:hypothetical protein
LVGVGLSAAILAGVPAWLRAQPAGIRFGEDIHALRFVLQMRGLKPLAGINEAAEKPDRTLIIVLGDVTPLDKLPGLRAFVEGGGAVLAASDRRTDGTLGRAFGVWVVGGFLEIDAESPSAYRQLPECPLVQAVSSFQTLGTSSPPIFQGLTHVASNRPSYLRSRDLPVLAALPGGCRAPDQDNDLSARLLRLAGRGPSFAAGGQVGRGRIIVLADHSIFINDMMLQQDNDNFDLAYNGVRWLSEGVEPGSPDRDRALVVYEGETVADFDANLPTIEDFPVPPVEVLDRLLGDLQQDSGLDRLILRNIGLAQLLCALALIMTVALAGYGLVRLGQTDPALEAEASLPSGEASGQSNGSLMDLRHQAMVRQGNLWEAARQLARQYFAGIDRSLIDPSADSSPPDVTVEGGRRESRDLRDSVERLWRIAAAPSAGRVSPREYARLVARVRALEAARADGRVRYNGEQPHGVDDEYGHR